MTNPKDDLARLEPYLADIRRAAAHMCEDPALLAAIMLRETWAGWAPGYYPKGSHDGGGDDPDGEAGPRLPWGRGLMQIDRRGPYRKSIPAPGQPWPVLEQLQVACVVLADARRELHSWRAHPLFTRAWVAAYNAGSPAVARALRLKLDPDSVTTPGRRGGPGDYGADVWGRRGALLARAPDLFTLTPAGG